MHHTEFPDTFNLPQQQTVKKDLQQRYIKRSEWIKYFMILYAFVGIKKQIMSNEMKKLYYEHRQFA